jgi:chromosome segregation ATPase
MREQIEKRLATLRTEMEAGEKMMAELEAKQAHLQSTLLRISGAIQVLQELLNPEQIERPTAVTFDSLERMPVTAGQE